MKEGEEETTVVAMENINEQKKKGVCVCVCVCVCEAMSWCLSCGFSSDLLFAALSFSFLFYALFPSSFSFFFLFLLFPLVLITFSSLFVHAG